MRFLLALLFVVATVSTSAADPTPAWQWDTATPDLFPRADLSVEQHGTTYTLALRGHKASTNGKNGTAKLELDNGTWSVAVDGSDVDELTGAALAADDARIYVATYNRIATGCTLAAYRAKDGALVWTVELTGAGPVSHSKYSNRVQLSLLDGKPTVFGSESASRYVEVRDPATGALVGNTQLATERAERPLAEPLFVELDNMLAKQRSYRVDIDDFLTRHVLFAKADRKARAAAFQTAIDHLDGTLLQHGRYRLSLKLVDTGKHLVVDAKRD